jgi:hypothetical protein
MEDCEFIVIEQTVVRTGLVFAQHKIVQKLSQAKSGCSRTATSPE